MADEPRPSAGITDEELSAYLDDSLQPFRRAQVEAAVRADRALARKLQAYRKQEEGLRRLSAPALDEPVPEPMLEIVRRAETPPQPLPCGTAAWRRALLPLAASLLIGVALGWLLRANFPPDEDSLLEPFIHEAVVSHALFLTGEDLGAREGSSEPVLAAVRSPFRTPIRIPELLGGAWRPVQVRAVAGDGGPALQLAYASGDGLTSLLIRPHADNDELLMRFAEVDGRSVLYWLDGPLIYALVGESGEAELREMARSIYASTATGNPQEAPGAAPLQPTGTQR